MADNLKIILSTGFDFTNGNDELDEYIKKINNSKSVDLKIKFNLNDIQILNNYFSQQTSISDKLNNSLNTNNKIKTQGLGITKQENDKLQEQLSLFQRSQSILEDSAKRRYSHMGNAVKDIEEYKKSLDELTVSNGKIINSNTGAEVSLKDLRMQFRELRNDVQNSENAITDIKMNLNKFGSWIASSTLMLGFTRGLKDMVSSVNELSDAYINLKRVTDELDSTYEDLDARIFSMADSLGVQAKGLVDSIADFSKLGYSFEEAQNLAINASKLATAGDMDLTTATNNLSSAYAVFKDEISDVSELGDLFNAFGNKMQITSEGISTALTDSANSLKLAGNSVEQSLSLISGANATILAPDKVSNGLRTISMRLRGVSEEGEELTGDLREIVKEYTNGMVDIWDETNNQFKSTYDIVISLGKAFEETGAKQMSDAQKAATLEVTAGKNRVICSLYIEICA